MRVALFFDGKNFYEGMRGYDPTLEIDLERFADWVTAAAGGAGAELAGAYYYTGHSVDPAVGDVARAHALGGFLDVVANLRGYFVRREPRVLRHATCRVCRSTYEYSTEKRVDTRMVAELIQYAAVDSYDVAVLASGDGDLVPAVEAVDRLGKKVLVGHWPDQLVARELRAACFGRIDFGTGLESFISQRRRLPVLVDAQEQPVVAATPGAAAVADEGPLHDAVLRELRNAETQLPWVSRWYFVNRWRAEGLPQTVADRERIVSEMITRGQVIESMVQDAKGRLTTAIRTVEPSPLTADAASAASAPVEGPP